MKEKRLLNGFTPKEKGCQLLAQKVRPNDKCLCGSGKKQKHCHGIDTRYNSTEPKISIVPEPVVPVVEYIYVSLKHTHKKDKWFTMWRPNAANYTYLVDFAGTYTEPQNNDEVCSVPVELFNTLTEEVQYEGMLRTVLPNTTAVRKTIGTTLDKLKALRAYKF